MKVPCPSDRRMTDETAPVRSAPSLDSRQERLRLHEAERHLVSTVVVEYSFEDPALHWVSDCACSGYISDDLTRLRED
jgi:hypothetical protein